MRKDENTVKMVEDIVMTKGMTKSRHSFESGYDDYQFPLTVSFEEHGEYIVKIEGKVATVIKTI